MGAFWQTALLPGQALDKTKDYVNKIARTHPDMALKPDSCLFHAFANGTGILFNDDVLGFDHLAKALSDNAAAAVLLLYIYDDDFWGYYFYENGEELDRFCPVPDYFGEQEEPEFGNPALIAQYFSVTGNSYNSQDFNVAENSDNGKNFNVVENSDNAQYFSIAENSGNGKNFNIAENPNNAGNFNISEKDIENYYRRWFPSPSENTTENPGKTQPGAGAAKPKNPICETIADHNETAYPQDEHCYGDCWQIADFMEKLGYPWDAFDEEAGKNPDFLAPPPAPAPEPPPFVRVSMRPASPLTAFLNTHKAFENLPDIFEISYIWELLKKYPEEFFLLFDYENYDEAAKILTGWLAEQPENAELYILRAFCSISHPNPPRVETEEERLARQDRIRCDLDLAFLYAPDDIRLLRMHCQPENRLRHWSHEPKIPDERQLFFLDRLLALDPEYAPSYLLAKAYCHERAGALDDARQVLTELTHRQLPDAVDFSLSFEEIFSRLEPGKNLGAELERDYKTYIRDFLADNPKKKFRQAELCWKRKRAATPGLVHYEKDDLKLLP